jgi:GAF domain-containing protein
MAVGTAAGLSAPLPSPAGSPWIPPFLLLTAIVVISVILCLWWIRDHRVNAQRKARLLLFSFTEDLSMLSPATRVHERLTALAPLIPGASGVRLYLSNRSTGRLDCVAGAAEPECLSIHPESASGSLAGGVARAWRSRAPVHIPDARRSGVIEWRGPAAGPRAMLFLPMIAQNEVVGVLEIYAYGVRYFGPEERDALQHVANQAAASLKRNEQQTALEQFHRTQRIEAEANVLSTVASELRGPVENILLRSRRLVADERGAPLRGELIELARESEAASAILASLSSLGQTEPELSPVVEINGLVAGLLRLREREWKALGIDAQARYSRTPLYTAGPQSQIEKVLLNVLAHAEASVADSPGKALPVSVSAAGKRAVIEIGCPCRHDAAGSGRDPESAGLRIWRAIVQAHGGDVRLLRSSSGLCRVEIDLPLSPAAHQATRGVLACTILLVEPDLSFQARVVKDLGARGCRVVPVVSAEEALDMAQRLRFELLLCAARLPGLNWVEFFERVRDLAGLFVLMVDGVDVSQGPAFESGDGLVLRKSAYDAEIDRVLAHVETR